MSGGTVQIKGEGFTPSDEIWFRLISKAANDVKAENVKLIPGAISFTAPALSGNTDVLLKRTGKEQSLGTMYFAKSDSSTIDSTTIDSTKMEHLYAVKRIGNDSEFGEYNLDDGTFKPAFKLSVFMNNCIADGRSNIYFIASGGSDQLDGLQLMRYNLIDKTKMQLVAIEEDAFAFIGIIDGKLHYMKHNQTNGFSLLSVNDKGVGSLVKNFGQLSDDEYAFDEDGETRFVYDKASESVIITGVSTTADDDDQKARNSILSFSLETGVITIQHNPFYLDQNQMTSTRYNVAKTNDGVLLFATETTISTTITPDDMEVSKTTITYIDPATLTHKSDFTTVDCEFDAPTYMAGKKMLLCIDSDSRNPYTAWSYDLTTKSLKKAKNTDNFKFFFTMTY